MIVHIKNMVCQRCVMAVKTIFENNHIPIIHVTLGEVELRGDFLTDAQLKKIDTDLLALGFERIDDKKSRMIEQIKSIVIKEIHHKPQVDLKVNWSFLLADALHYDYHYLSGLFSSVEGITIEQYIIRQKVEKAKECLVYDEMNLSEIAEKLGYSSVAHLSNQFKKVTGLTPSAFKKNHQGIRKSIDKI